LKKSITLTITAVFLLLTFNPSLYAEQLNQESLKKAIRYYRKTTTIKKLNANDRLYILYRIRRKYSNTDLDLSAIDAEIAKQEIERARQKPGYLGKNTALLKRIYTKEEAAQLKVFLETSSYVKPGIIKKHFYSTDKSRLITLELPNTIESLANISKDIKFTDGPISRIKTEQFRKKHVKVHFTLKKDAKLNITNTSNKIIVTASTAGKKQPTPPVPEQLSPNHKMTKGDILKITVFPVIELTQTAVVENNGTINIPMAGKIPVEGLTSIEISNILLPKIKKYIRNAHVAVNVQAKHDNSFFIAGKVQHPGLYRYKSGLILKDALTEYGATDALSDTSNILIYRKSQNASGRQEIKQISKVPLNTSLKAGDIVKVPVKEASVFIAGEVINSGYYKHKDGLRLSELITGCGGLTMSAKSNKIYVLRDQFGTMNEIPVNLRYTLTGHPEKDITLLPADIIYIPAKRSLPNFLRPPISYWIYSTIGIISIILLTS